MWFRQALRVPAVVALCALHASALVLPSIQASWFGEQLLNSAVAQVQEGVQSVLYGTETALNDLRASYAYHASEVNANGVPEDVWERFIQLSDRVKEYAHGELEALAAERGVVGKVHAFQDTVLNVVNAASALTADVEVNGDVHTADVSEEISEVLQRLLEKLKEDFASPDQALHHGQRRAMVEEFWAQAEDAIVKLLVGRGIPEERVREHMDRLHPHVVNLIVMTGDLAEQHPMLLDYMLAFGLTLILPEQWLLRPLLGLFGWGPFGPVKGTVAAWAQRFFFGAAVEAGSWFAILQSAAMLQASWWLKITLGSIMAGIATAIASMCGGSR